MPKQEVPLNNLAHYLPSNCLPEVLFYLEKYKIHLTITRKRQTILGDYRHPHQNKTHRISVNGNLNKYSFLITLLHELAHLLTFEQFGNRIPPHGTEWKNEFGEILYKFIVKKIFPKPIEEALQKTLKNPAASSCGDENLLRILRMYDPKKEGIFLIEQIKEEAIFSIKGGKSFIRGPKIRTRYKCKEIATSKLYLFSGLYEVTLLSN